jgi:hypothetical protein
MHKHRFILERDGDNFSLDKRMGRPPQDLPIDPQEKLCKLPVEECIEIFILHLKREVMRR